MSAHRWPLIQNNITLKDKKDLISFIQKSDRFTQGPQVARFEEAWSKWLGVKRSLFVSSGSAANFITFSALRDFKGVGEVIVPPLTWVSDIVSVIENGFTPVFADINPQTLALDINDVKRKLTSSTKAVFLTHILGLNGVNKELISLLKQKGILLIEDCCESHGAKWGSKKIGTLGFASNFSFYYGHHMTTIEGGMVCTDNLTFAEILRIKRGHGMLRESRAPDLLAPFLDNSNQVHPEFDFPLIGYNFRNNELGATLGLSQLKRLDSNNLKRNERFSYFIEQLRSDIYFTDYDTKGSSSYALLLQIRPEFSYLRPQVIAILQRLDIEYRCGMSGGGNQLRQGFLKTRGISASLDDFKNTEQIHKNGFYLGNYPTLPKSWIKQLCKELNNVDATI